LPTRILTGPNVVEYAIRTDNPLGVQVYNRLVALGDSVASQWRCDRFLSSDLAQKAFFVSRWPRARYSSIRSGRRWVRLRLGP
jgi:hypothetical protein